MPCLIPWAGNLRRPAFLGFLKSIWKAEGASVNDKVLVHEERRETFNQGLLFVAAISRFLPLNLWRIPVHSSLSQIFAAKLTQPGEKNQRCCPAELKKLMKSNVSARPGVRIFQLAASENRFISQIRWWNYCVIPTKPLQLEESPTQHLQAASAWSLQDEEDLIPYLGLYLLSITVGLLRSSDVGSFCVFLQVLLFRFAFLSSVWD